jgi:hypothetical protein
MVRNRITAQRAAWLGALTIASLAAATPAQAKPDAPYGTGNLAEGEFEVDLFRGAAVPFELTVVETPNNCEGSINLNVKWNAAEDTVDLQMRSDNNTLEQFPNVDRTFGVDYLPNPFFPEPEDITNGRYQLWLISASGPIVNFWYDPMTLDLVGGPTEFPTPPEGLIPVPFPTLYMFATPLFQPNEHGKVNVNWQFPYSSPHRGDRPEYSYHIVTFPPPNLCGANPFRLDLSTLRGYITDPFPRAEARPWDDYLRGGMLFDVTIEPENYYVEPPLTTLTATYSGGTAVGGSIPRDWQLDIDAAFAGLAPPIKPFAGANSCDQYFEGFHTIGANFCPPAP